MLIAVEILVFVLLLGKSWRIASQGFCLNMIGLTVFLCSAAVGAFAYILSGWMTAFITENLLIKYVFPLLTSVVVCLAISIWLGKYYRVSWSEYLQKTKPFQYMNRWIDGVLCAFLVVVFSGATFGVIFSVVSFASEIESSRNLIYERSFFLRLLLPAEESRNLMVADASNSNDGHLIDDRPGKVEWDTDEILNEQELLLEGLGARWEEAKNYLGEKTGADFVRERLRAMQFLYNMPLEDKEWLLQKYPDLREVLDNSLLQNIRQDERLLGLVDEAANGSWSAFYRLGDEKAVQDLLEDKRIYQAVLKIELLEMQAAVQNRRKKEK